MQERVETCSAAAHTVDFTVKIVVAIRDCASPPSIASNTDHKDRHHVSVAACQASHAGRFHRLATSGSSTS